MTIFAEKQFQAEEAKLPEILGWVEEVTMEYLSMDAALKMQLAAEEAIVNVCKYAYEGLDVEEKPLKISLGEDGESVFLEIEDKGRPFNPLENISADPTLSFEEREEGGWGRTLILKMTSKAVYDYIKPRNILRLEEKNEAGQMPNFADLLEE